MKCVLLFCIWASLLLAWSATQAQVLVPATGSNTVACGTNTTLCDNGGCVGNYANNSNGFTVLQNGGTAVINITGTYDVEDGFDFIYIYDGTGTGGTLLQTLTDFGTLNFTSNPGQTITIVFESDFIVNAPGFNFNVTYTGPCTSGLLVPATGSNTVTCGSSAVTLCDNGGCGANYANNSNGFTVFQSAGLATININGNFDVEDGFDFIRIYAGTGTGGTLLQTLTGTGTFNYTSAPGQTITIQFESDNSVVASGFSFTVSYSGSCSNTVLTPATGSNVIACGSPNLTLCDNGGCTANYANNSNGFTVLQNGGTSVITITGTYATEANWDFVRIYDGVGTGGTLLQTLTGTGTLNFTSNPGQVITIQFTSDGSINAAGFSFNVSYAGPCTTNLLVPTTGSNTVACGSSAITLCDNGGCTADYANNSDGFTVLENGGFAVINITGTYNVESGFDFIRIYSGTGTGGTLLQTLTGSGSFNFTSNPGQAITIRFQSDNSVAFSGFNFNVNYSGSCVAQTNIPQTGSDTIACGAAPFTLCDNGGCTGNYANSSDGFTVLRNGGNSVITITGNYATENNFDFIRIYAGAGTGGTLLQTLTGTGTLNFTSNPGQIITIRFQSDAVINGVGFNFNVSYAGQCTIEREVPLTGSDTVACGSSAITLCDNGTCTGNYANNSDGFTVFQAQSTAQVRITGSYNVEDGFDFIRIYAGAGTGGTLLQTLTGSGTLNFTGAPGQAITVRFQSDASVTETGFSFNVEYLGSCDFIRNVPLTGSDTLACGTPPTTVCDNGGCTGNYANNSDGFLVLNNLGSAVITITGNYVTENNFDFIRIYDGAGTGGTLLQTLTGTGTLNFTSNPGQVITIRFQSDFIVDAAGFQFLVSYTGRCINCPAPSASIAVSPSVICPADTARLEVSMADPTMPYTYQWDNHPSLNGVLNVANPLISGLMLTDTFRVIVTDTIGCEDTASFIMPVHPMAVLNIANLGDTSFCQGFNTTFQVSGAQTYVWSDGTLGRNITVFDDQPYQVTATDGNGCTSTATSPALVVFPRPLALITPPSGQTTFCFGTGLDLQASPQMGYLWNTGETTQNITVFNSNTYRLSVVDGNGCTADTTINVVAQFGPLAVINTLGNPFFCANASVTDSLVLRADAAATYLWSTGETTQDIVVPFPGGTYGLTVTDNLGCVGDDARLAVNVLPPFTPNIQIQGCDPYVLSVGNFASYLWSTGQTTTSINISNTGLYEVTVTDFNGCQGDDLFNFQAPAPLSLVLDSLAAETSPLNGSIQVSATGGTAPYFFAWNTGQTGPSLTGLQAATYSVTLTDANGCEVVANFTLPYNIVIAQLDEYEQLGDNLQLFPNPTSGLVYLQFEGLMQSTEAQFRLFDARGALLQAGVWQLDNAQTQSLDLSAYPGGWYHLQVQTGDKVWNRPVVVKK